MRSSCFLVCLLLGGPLLSGGDCRSEFAGYGWEFGFDGGADSLGPLISLRSFQGVVSPGQTRRMVRGRDDRRVISDVYGQEARRRVVSSLRFHDPVSAYSNRRCSWPWNLVSIANYSSDFEAIREGDSIAALTRNTRSVPLYVDFNQSFRWENPFAPLDQTEDAVPRVNLEALPLVYKLKYFFPNDLYRHNAGLFSAEPQTASGAVFIGFHYSADRFTEFIKRSQPIRVFVDGSVAPPFSPFHGLQPTSVGILRSLEADQKEGLTSLLGSVLGDTEGSGNVFAEFVRHGWCEGLFPGDVYVNGLGMRFRWCPAGQFWMGSPPQEQFMLRTWLDASDETLHPVSLSQGFWIGEHEVTQGEWRSLMGRSLVEERDSMLEETGRLQEERGRVRDVREFVQGASGPGAENQVGEEKDNLPIYWITWKQAVEFCERLTKREREAGRLGVNAHYALPTEAQWEYACRAATRTCVYSGDMLVLGRNNAPGLDPIAWYAGNSSVGYEGRGWAANLPEKQYPGGVAGPRMVSSKLPNDWGLHDMLGNVAEWCSDWYGPATASQQSDPTGPAAGNFRVFRGGGWSSMAAGCRSAFRNWNAPETREYYVGFRLVLVR